MHRLLSQRIGQVRVENLRGMILPKVKCLQQRGTHKEKLLGLKN